MSNTHPELPMSNTHPELPEQAIEVFDPPVTIELPHTPGTKADFFLFCQGVFVNFVRQVVVDEEGKRLEKPISSPIDTASMQQWLGGWHMRDREMHACLVRDEHFV